MSTTNTGMGSSAVSCPFCSSPIHISLKQVVAGDALQCGSCSAVLTLNRESSAETLQKLAQWLKDNGAAFEEPEAIKDEPVMIPRWRKPRRSRS